MMTLFHQWASSLKCFLLMLVLWTGTACKDPGMINITLDHVDKCGAIKQVRMYLLHNNQCSLSIDRTNQDQVKCNTQICDTGICVNGCPNDFCPVSALDEGILLDPLFAGRHAVYFELYSEVNIDKKFDDQVPKAMACANIEVQQDGTSDVDLNATVGCCIQIK